MTIHDDTDRAQFAAHTIKADKRTAGRTDAAETQLELRAQSGEIDDSLREWVYDRLGRQLGKYAPQIERIQVRFGDLNGPRGGTDKCCMVHIVLSKLPPVVVEMRGDTEREAFDLAAGRAERATRRNLQRHGYSTRHETTKQKHDGMMMSDPDEGAENADDGAGESEDSIMGARSGHGDDQLMIAQQRSEKVRRDLPVDTSEPGVAADDRKAGYGHTAKRNTKLNTAGMKHALEDSTTDRPSRKSTRRGANRIKPDNPLTQRTKSAVTSPQSQASRAQAREH